MVVVLTVFYLWLFRLTQSSAPVLIKETYRLLLDNQTNTDDTVINGSVEWYELQYNQAVQQTVKKLLNYALGVYANESCIKHWQDCPSQCFTENNILMNLTVKTDDYVQYISGYDSTASTMVISFRGTDNPDNRCTDCEFTKTVYAPVTGTCNGCEIHEGFYKIWQTLKPDVYTNLDSLKKWSTGCNISITGHSLGAAISQIATMEIKSNLTWADCHIYNVNFGSPGFGNTAMVNYFTGIVNRDGINTWRIVNRHDLVPLFGNRHDGFSHTDVFIHYKWTDTSPYKLSYTVCQRPYTGDCAYGFSEYCIVDHLHYLQSSDATCKHDPNYSRSTGECRFDEDLDVSWSNSTDEFCDWCICGNWEACCHDIWPCVTDDIDTIITTDEAEESTDQGYMRLSNNMPMYLFLSILQNNVM